MPRGANVNDACEDGEHIPAWDGEAMMKVCDVCGLSSQTIVDSLGHSFKERNSDQ